MTAKQQDHKEKSHPDVQLLCDIWRLLANCGSKAHEKNMGDKLEANALMGPFPDKLAKQQIQDQQDVSDKLARQQKNIKEVQESRQEVLDVHFHGPDAKLQHIENGMISTQGVEAALEKPTEKLEVMRAETVRLASHVVEQQVLTHNQSELVSAIVDANGLKVQRSESDQWISEVASNEDEESSECDSTFQAQLEQ
ncbi:unnamed protein product, partial [Prorocentrum cordatum]